MNSIDYDSRKLAEFYNYHRRFGAVFYDTVASQYGIKDGNITCPAAYYFFHDKLLNLIRCNITAGAILIDIGCGSGILAEVVFDRVNKYIGVDISIERIKQAIRKTKFNNCFFVVADAQHLPFKDSSFDTAVAIELIEHLPDTDLFIKEVKRVLVKKSCLFIFSTPRVLISENNIWQLYKDQHLYEFSLTKIKPFLERNAFYIRSVKGIGFKLPKVKIPIWLGSDIIKYIYKKIRNVELKSGYGHSISLQFDVISNPLFNKIYFVLRWKRPWITLMKIFEILGKYILVFSSHMVIICLK